MVTDTYLPDADCLSDMSPMGIRESSEPSLIPYHKLERVCCGPFISFIECGFELFEALFHIFLNYYSILL